MAGEGLILRVRRQLPIPSPQSSPLHEGEAVRENTELKSCGRMRARTLFVPVVLHPGDPKQTFRGHVTCDTCPVCLVANGADPLA